MRPVVVIATIYLLSLSCRNNSETDLDKPLERHMSGSDTVHSTPSDTIILLAEAVNKMFDSIRNGHYTGNNNFDFIRMMKFHQQAGIEMHAIISKNGQNEELKKISEHIARRIDSIPEISGKQASKQEKSTFVREIISMVDTLTKNGLAMHGGYLDLDFSTVMIQHHTVTIKISQFYLQKTSDARFAALAKQTISSATHEMETLRKWKAKYYPTTE